jgi:hypothetical protein
LVSRNPEEAIVDFDPDGARQYLEGIDYPASKEDLASAAEGNGAPEELVEDFKRAVSEVGLEDQVHYLSHGDTYEFEVPSARGGV